MTCPKCGAELETYECDRTNSTHTIPHRPSQCFAALVKQRDYWKELSNKFSLAPELARIEAAEARAAELEAKLKSAREALDIIATCPDEAVHLTPMIAQATIAEIDKEGT